MKDMKEALTSNRKPDITHMRTSAMVYHARTCEYGTAKGYERANYQRPTQSVAADFLRLRAYLRASVSHAMATLDSMERHQATDPQLKNEEGMRRAAYCADTDVTPGAPVGASGLPHVCGSLASLVMAIEQAVQCGLLPKDPGQPWAENAEKLAKYDPPPLVVARHVVSHEKNRSFGSYPVRPSTSDFVERYRVNVSEDVVEEVER